MPKPLKQRFEEKINKTDACWLWTGFIDKHGYGRLMKDGKDTGAHRVAWFLHKGAIPDGMQVLHKCDVRHCVNPDHLFLGTHADNHLDKCDKGRVRRGKEHWHYKISDEDVKLLRSLPFSKQSLAKIFGISESYANNLKYGRHR